MKMISKKILMSILIDILTFIMLGILGISIYYNFILQEQIEERDRIIQDLSFNKKLVENYFEIQTDSIGYKTYYLKQNEKEHAILDDARVILDSAAYLSEKCSKEYKDIVIRYINLQHKYNSLLEDKESIVYQAETQKMALELIENSFGISYESKRDSNEIYVKIHAEKADSAFMLFPYYRNRLKKSQGGTWLIEVEQNGKRE